MKTKLILLRGEPGTGKSTLARNMIEAGKADCYFEADMYMIDSEGNYQFDPKRLGYCHNMCYKMVSQSLKEGKIVICSNTNLKTRDIRQYVELVKENSCGFEIIDLEDQGYKSIHNVPDWKIEDMRKGREYSTVEQLMGRA